MSSHEGLSRPTPAAGPVTGPIYGRVRNPFAKGTMARQYARGRPYYHEVALKRAAGQLGLGRAETALDIGCGTGLSTQALLERADRVLAVDISLPMLRSATAHPRATFVRAAAEHLPLPDRSADLATAGASFHWFDQERVLAELARVLKPGGALAVYSDYFHGELPGRPEFADWLNTSYLPRFPSPARHAYFDSRAADAAGFAPTTYGEGPITITLTAAQLAEYMLSQSNAVTAIEAGQVTADELKHLIRTETSAFFPDNAPADFAFGIRVWTTTLTA